MKTMKKLQNENFNQSVFFPDTTVHLAIISGFRDMNFQKM